MIVSARRCLVLATTVALLGGCGGSPDPTREDAVEPTSSSSPSSPTDPGDAAPTGATGRAVADLADRLGIEPAAIEVVAVEEVTWRDGSRGCAEPGTMYTQALVDGTRITLRANGTDHEYHSGGAQPPTLCEDPTE